jgi:glycosyltransferase involved in cell wall biosynthesis
MKKIEISVIIPTLNSEKYLEECLNSIRTQEYPQEKIEIIIIDGGSTDSTVDIAKKYKTIILKNPLKTGEAGKAVGLKKAKGEFILSIDSDNILENKDSLKRLIHPLLKNKKIVSSEVLYWAYRKQDTIINRYCALTGINDPLCLFLGNYDRYSYLTDKWTEMPHEEADKGDYLEVSLYSDKIPTMGANGYLVRKKALDSIEIGDYYFDIDVVYKLIQKGYRKISRPKIGIIHYYCKDFKTFIRKQTRRINDFIYHKSKKDRDYPWNKMNKLKLLKFIIYSTLIFPTFFQALRGFLEKKDIAWFFHPVACFSTLFIYGFGFLKGFFIKKHEERKGWKQ